MNRFLLHLVQRTSWRLRYSILRKPVGILHYSLQEHQRSSKLVLGFRLVMWLPIHLQSLFCHLSNFHPYRQLEGMQEQLLLQAQQVGSVGLWQNRSWYWFLCCIVDEKWCYRQCGVFHHQNFGCCAHRRRLQSYHPCSEQRSRHVVDQSRYLRTKFFCFRD